MWVDLRVIPRNAETSERNALAEILELVKGSGLACEQTSGGACIEGDWDAVVRLARRCHERAGRASMDEADDAAYAESEASRTRATLHSVGARAATLTRREREVFRWVTLGLMNKQIAARLGTAEKTVKVHRGRVMAKMHAGSLAELVRMYDLLDSASVRPGASPPPLQIAPRLAPVG